MAKFNDVKGFQGERKDYSGRLLGICAGCKRSPKMQKSKKWATFRVICQCGNKTMDYGNMSLAATAWNGKNHIPIGE